VRIVLVLLVALAACEPDYSDTAFLCDPDRDCPPDQLCEAGRCRRGGVAGSVACGAGVACTGAEQCCVDGNNPPRCIPAADTCPGIAALCDGLADCPSGDQCCDGDLTYCRASCGDTLYAICTVDTDCPSSDPHCCFTTGAPWGRCEFRACGE
jgi:hypothetical protein